MVISKHDGWCPQEQIEVQENPDDTWEAEIKHEVSEHYLQRIEKDAFQRGLTEGRKAGLREAVEVLVRLGYLKGGKLIDAIKPRHGNCCTCQRCGYAHEDCVCAHNELLEAIEREIVKGGGK